MQIQFPLESAGEERTQQHTHTKREKSDDEKHRRDGEEVKTLTLQMFKGFSSCFSVHTRFLNLKKY